MGCHYNDWKQVYKHCLECGHQKMAPSCRNGNLVPRVGKKRGPRNEVTKTETFKNTNVIHIMRARYCAENVMSSKPTFSLNHFSGMESRQKWINLFNKYYNRPFPSSLVPLFQNESKCETFHMKMSSACSFICMQIKVIFIRIVLHLDSLWKRGTRELGNGLFMPYLKKYFTISLLCTWQGAGISGIKVHRITRVHNRILRTRFDEKLDQILDQNDIADLTKYELIFNRLLICVVSILKWSILSLRTHRNEVSFAAVFWDVTQHFAFEGSVVWHPKKRLRRRLTGTISLLQTIVWNFSYHINFCQLATY